jgi:type VI secretion system protein VasD
MNGSLWSVSAAFWGALLLGLVGCASKPPAPPPPTVIQATIDVAANVNPDANGRPSPVVFKVYELKSLAAFNAADFFALFDKDKETLGAELLNREEYRLMPGEKRQFERKLQPDTRYIGAMAAFRDLGRAQWRATMTVVPEKTTVVTIKLDGDNVTISGR